MMSEEKREVVENEANEKKESKAKAKASKKDDKLVKENEQLKAQLSEFDKRYETCPYRSTDMGCDYCDYRDRNLKDEVINDR